MKCVEALLLLVLLACFCCCLCVIADKNVLTFLSEYVIFHERVVEIK